MKRKKHLEIVQAVIDGQKDKAAYLLQHVNDPEVRCYIISPNDSATYDGKILTVEELNQEILKASKFGIECIEVDFSEAL